MQDAKLFASQGGPIILSQVEVQTSRRYVYQKLWTLLKNILPFYCDQIENEYGTIQLAFKEPGTQYIQWAGAMAAGLKTGVPWIMCKQQDAPDLVVSDHRVCSSPMKLHFFSESKH